MKKNFTVVFIFVLVLICSSLFLVSCDNSKTVNIVSIEAISNTFVTKYTVGDELNLEGALIRVTYSNGNIENVPVTEDMIDKTSFSTAFPANRKTMKIFYKNFVCTLPYQVQDEIVELTVTKAYLENMPTSFLKGESLTLTNGIIEGATLCLELSDDSIMKYPVKEIWLNSFSTSKVGSLSCTVDYESDYGPVSVKWEYTVLNLATVAEIVFETPIAIYQTQTENHLRNALSGKTFLVKYADDTTEEVAYNSNFKISGFSSDKIGNARCTLMFTDSMGREIKYTLNYTVKQNYAVYSVTFDENYEGGSKITINTFDGKVPTPSLNRPGYEPSGWYLWDGTKLSSEPFDFNSIIENDITLRPRWRRITYTITIYSFGTLLRAPEEYNVETERPIDPPAPIDGYTFSHYADEQGKVINNIQKGTTGNLVLNCVWIADGYNITYDLNDAGSSIKATNPNPNKYTKEEPLEFLPAQRKGYNFEGWYYNNELITSTEGLSKDIRIVARWNIAEYTVTMINPITNETIRSFVYKVTDSDTKIANYQSDLYNFYGWFKDREFTQEFTFDSSHQYYLPKGSAGNIELFAKLEVKYTINLDGRNNSQIKPVYFVDADETVELPIPTYFGADFISWLGQGIFNGIDFVPTSNKIIVSTADLKNIMIENNTQCANFIARYDYHQWNITFNHFTDYQGQEVTSSDSYYTNIQKDLPTPEREGYTFLGWYKNSSYTGTMLESIAPGSSDSDLVLYAKWKATVYTITTDYYFEDVEKTYIPKTYTADDQITLPNPSYPNYIFVGWYLDADYVIAQSSIIDKGTTGNITLFAKWEAVSFEMNLLNMSGANYDGDITYTLAQDVVVLQSATKRGYMFDGWYLDKELTNKVESFETKKYPEGRIFTAYAKWSLTVYNINYVLNDSTVYPATNINQTTITIEDELLLAEPTRNTYTFMGWYLSDKFEGDPVSVLSFTSNDVQLYAKWTERIYTITYENCDFEGVDTSKLKTTFKATSTGTTLSTLTRKHYNFDGWYIGDTHITKVGVASDALLCNDLVLTAKWTAKNYTLTLSVDGKSGKVTYTADDFVDGVYTIPTLDSLIPDLFAESYLYGKEFLGWYKRNVSSVFYTTIDIEELGSMTFYASTSYINYQIIYHLPDEAVKPDTNPTSFTVKSSSFYVANPSFEGKVFAGWFTDSEYTTPAGTQLSGKTSIITTASNIDLYAKFVDIYNISYQLTDGITLPLSAPHTYNETASVTITEPTSNLYNFGGWWWIEKSRIVTNTADFGSFGDVTLKSLTYDKTASPKLIFTLNDTNNTATVTGYSGNTTTLKFPEEVSGYKVTSIADTAFYNNTVITMVTIPETIISVGYRAFANCSELTTLTINGGTISSEAFVNCTKLQNVTIASNTKVPDGVFANCTSITTMNVGNSKAIVAYFGKTINSNCVLCGSYYVPKTLTTIKLIGSPENSNNILSACTTVKSLYIDGTTFVALSNSDVITIKNNNITVYVSSELLAEYQSTYAGVNFVVS